MKLWYGLCLYEGDCMEIKIMVLGLLIMLFTLFLYKKYPEIKRKLKDRKLEADYFRKMSKR